MSGPTSAPPCQRPRYPAPEYPEATDREVRAERTGKLRRPQGTFTDTQATLVRKPPPLLGLGEVTVDHELPSHRSMSVWRGPLRLEM